MCKLMDGDSPTADGKDFLKLLNKTYRQSRMDMSFPRWPFFYTKGTGATHLLTTWLQAIGLNNAIVFSLDRQTWRQIIPVGIGFYADWKNWNMQYRRKVDFCILDSPFGKWDVDGPGAFEAFEFARSLPMPFFWCQSILSVEEEFAKKAGLI